MDLSPTSARPVLPWSLVGPLVARIEQLATSVDRRVLIGIAGPPGVGKTTLVETLIRDLAGREDWRGSRAAHVPMDGFHLADAELEREGLRERKGAPETFDVAGYRALIARVRAGEDVYAPAFERDLEQPLASALPILQATRIVLSEGNYLLLPDPAWCAVRAEFDEVWFCRTDAAHRRDRLIARHMRFGKSRRAAVAWVDSVDEPNGRLVEGTRVDADLVLDLP